MKKTRDIKWDNCDFAAFPEQESEWKINYFANCQEKTKSRQNAQKKVLHKIAIVKLSIANYIADRNWLQKSNFHGPIDFNGSQLPTLFVLDIEENWLNSLFKWQQKCRFFVLFLARFASRYSHGILAFEKSICR